jgi:UPF0755 protein
MTKKISLTLKLLGFAVLLCLAGLLSAAGGWWYLQKWLVTPLDIAEQGYSYELKPGQSLGHLAYALGSDNVLEHPFLLRLYARYAPHAQLNKIHAGEYYFPQGTTPKSLLEKLAKGEVVLYQITFVEGWTYKQALNALAKHESVKSVLQGKNEQEQIDLLSIPVTQLEGWIFPDTYSFSRNTTDVEILQKAYQKMLSLLNEEWETRAPDLPYQSSYEALIMASIVERETGHHSERDQIAGVFVRRLQQGMKLQTDPTVIYGMGERYQGRIRRADLEEATSHNTYVIPGLPPTPISLPSAASIRAALHPAPGKALYFVAKGDGTSEFSETLAQHNQAVRRYQLNRKSDYRSTPSPIK